MPIFRIFPYLQTTLLFILGDALQCYECTYNKLDSSFGVLDFVLSAFEKISDEHCLLKTEEDKHTMAIKNCPRKKFTS